MPESILSNISQIWRQISKRRKLQFKFLVILLVLSSFAEVISISAIFPFFGALIQPENVLNNKFALPILRFLEIKTSKELALPMTILFCSVILIASLIRVSYIWFSVKFSFALGVDLSNDIYRRTLYQPYIVHVSRNSSDIINGIWIKVSEVIFYILNPIMTLISSFILVLTIVITLILVTPSIAIISIATLIAIYGVIIFLTKKKLKINSKTIAIESNNIIKNLQEGLSGIRDVLIDGSQDRFLETYTTINDKLRRAQAQNQIISQVPNFLLTSLGMILISILAYSLTMEDGFTKAIPGLAALTLGLQRLMPSAQQLYTSWSTISGSQNSLMDVVNLLNQPYPKEINDIHIKKLPFKDEIELTNVTFRYHKESNQILNGVNLKIKKGKRIGFVGTTGCGKSTLVDIIMGLLTPESGTLKVDGENITSLNSKAWQMNIAHVPQSVFLADNSIESNIAFGIPKELVDKEKVINAASKAQLAEIIESWPDKYQTRVGERGVQLSGGQCQRIGLARALYRNANIIVLDEATSALDSQTENEVISSIKGLSKDVTIIMIAHRLNTLNFCDEIIELEQGGKIKSRNFNEN
jgi:ABC-type bacteriocin/lantibiotic exporter with double-glycine peptidase domain